MEQLLRFLRAIWLAMITALTMCKAFWDRNAPPLSLLPLPAQLPQQKKKKSKRKKNEIAEPPEKPVSSSHSKIVAKMDFFAKYKDSCTLERIEDETVTLSCERTEQTVVIQKSLQGYLSECCLTSERYSLRLPSTILALMDQFNCLASFENNYHFALFLYDSGTFLKDPNKWNLMCNASLSEIEQVLIEECYKFQLISGKNPMFQLEQMGIPIRIRPIPGPPEEDLLTRIQYVQYAVSYKQNSLMCTYLAGNFYWRDPFNVLTRPKINKFYTLELLCRGNSIEEKAETIMQSIIFLALREDYRIDDQTKKWFVDNKTCLQSPTVLDSFVHLLQCGKSSRGLWLLKLFGLLEALCPSLIPWIEIKDFNSGTANFDRHISRQFREQMPRNYQNVLYETLALFLYPACEQIMQTNWKSTPFLNSGQISMIEAHWANNANIANYWSEYLKAPAAQTLPQTPSLNSSPTHH